MLFSSYLMFFIIDNKENFPTKFNNHPVVHEEPERIKMFAPTVPHA